MNGIAIKGQPQDHPYLHADGHTVLKRRFDYVDGSKSFKWPTGTSMGDILPFGTEDLKRLQDGEAILILEGERCVDAVARHGFIALCMPGGSGQKNFTRLKEVLEPYPDHPIFLFPDNDKPGFGHMEAMFSHLKAYRPEVRWVPPVVEAPGGDMADLLAPYREEHGKARELVLEAITSALERPPGLTPAEVPSRQRYEVGEDFNDLADEPDEPMVSYGLFSEGTWIIAGAPKLGKSWFGLSYAHGLSIGGAVLGSVLVGEPCDVLAFILEDGRRRFKQRIKRRLEGTNSRPDRGRFTVWFKWPRLDEESLAKMEEMIQLRSAAGRKVCVVIDTGTKLRPLEDRQSSIYMGDYNFLDPITEIAQRYHCLILVVAHTRKAPSVDFIDNVIGSHGISGAVDGIAVLSRERHSKQATLEWTGRDGDEQKAYLVWDEVSDGWLLTDEPDEATNVRRAVQSVIERIKSRIAEEGRPMSAKELRIGLAIKANTLSDALDLATQWGQLTKNGDGKRGDPVLYDLPVSVPGIDTD